MVLESLTDALKAEKNPGQLIILGMVITCIAIFLAHLIFPQYASVVYVFFVVMACIPLMINIIKLEEKKDVSDFHEVALLKEHGKALKAFMALFLGITIAVVILYVVLPAEFNANIFSSQTSTINQINSRVTEVTGAQTSSLAAHQQIKLSGPEPLKLTLVEKRQP